MKHVCEDQPWVGTFQSGGPLLKLAIHIDTVHKPISTLTYTIYKKETLQHNIDVSK